MSDLTGPIICMVTIVIGLTIILLSFYLFRKPTRNNSKAEQELCKCGHSKFEHSYAFADCDVCECERFDVCEFKEEKKDDSTM